MIRTLLLGGAAAFSFCAAVSAQPMPSMAPPPAGSSSQALPTPDFLTAAGQSDTFEVKEGKLAARRGHSAKVRSMGAMMVHDHTKSTAMIKAAAKSAGLPPMAPPGLDADQQQMLSELTAAHGVDFDKTYVDQQVQAHEKTLGVMSAYAASGDSAPIKAAAGKITPVVKTHLAKFQALQSG